MDLRSLQEVENTRSKLKMLEEQYDDNRRRVGGNQHVRDVSARSLKRLINQLKEEIVRFESKHLKRASTDS